MCIEIKCHTETHKMMFLQINIDGHYKVIHKRLKQILIVVETKILFSDFGELN